MKAAYGRFLTITIVAIAIATIMATVEIAKYISVGGRLATGIGDVVGAASVKLSAVYADEL